MQQISKITLRKKLVAVVVLSMLLALVIATTLVTIYLRKSSQDELVSEITTLAKITALRSSAALAFEDKRAIKSNLDALLLESSVDQACVYTSTGELFASAKQANIYSDCPAIENVSLKAGFLQDSLQVLEGVSIKGRSVGRLLIIANLQRVKDQTSQFIIVAISATLLSALLVYFVVLKLTRWVARPVTKLAEVANKIRQDEDYSLRATVTSNDETGELVNNFNNMIGKIQSGQIHMASLIEELEERAKLNEVQAEKMSHRHDAIRDFFSGVTHDLRQPLQAIDMYVEVLQKMKDAEEVGVTQTKLQQAVSNLRQLFGELLDVTRFEAQVENLTDLEPVELSSVIKNICHEFDIVAQEKGLRLATHLRDCRVLSEPAMLERIIRNLVSNAVRYTEHGGVLIGIRLRPESVWVDVWDTGRGIPEAKQEKIFRQFSQVLDADAEQGYGLGLSIVHRLSIALGHTIRVKSIEGKGTLFRLEIPCSSPYSTVRGISEDKTEKVSDMAGEAVTSQMAALSTDLSVVVIDDDPDALGGMQSLLQSWGMQVCSFPSAQAVLGWMESSTEIPSLIICDYDLGAGDNGTELLQKLQERFEGSVPGLIVSGTADSSALSLIKQSGYNMLSKPVKPPKLRAMINYLVTQV